MYTQIDPFCVVPSSPIKEVMARMNENRDGIVLVVDGERHLVGIVTDGDIRRAVLAQIALDLPVTALLESKKGTRYEKPLCAQVGQAPQVYLDLLQQHRLLHLPIVNQSNQVVGLVASDEFVMESLSSLKTVVMAGGKGSRLLPLTEDLPKPMLPIGEKPLLEIIINQLRSAGIQRINVTTHHKGNLIQNYFGDGHSFGVGISYVPEDRPLGTAGALSLLEDVNKTMLVINGDVLTQVDFRAMLQFHREHKADLTVGVRAYDLEVPYGVVECQDVNVQSIKEKPSLRFLINAGVYLLEPKVHSLIPSDQHYNMTDLIQKLVEQKCRVVSFPIHEYWLDIGEHRDYERAKEEASKLDF